MYRTIRTGSPRNAVSVAAVSSSTKRLPASLKAFQAAWARPGFACEAGDISVGDDSTVLVGLGDHPPTQRSLRLAGAKLAATLRSMGASAAQIDIPLHLSGPLAKKPAEAAQAIAEGIVLANWRQETWRGTAAKGEAASGTLILTSSSAAVRGGLRRGCILAEGSNEARRLSSTPPNIASPAWVARQARAMSQTRHAVLDYFSCKS